MLPRSYSGYAHERCSTPGCSAEFGANVDLRDNRGMTALMMAASVGRPETGKALIDWGADVSARNESGLMPLAGYTPLMRGAQNKNSEIVKLLVSRSS